MVYSRKPHGIGRRFIGSGNAWVGDGSYRGWQVSCGGCGAIKVISTHQDGGHMPPEILVKKFTAAGWQLTKRPDINPDFCPACVERRKQERRDRRAHFHPPPDTPPPAPHTLAPALAAQLAAPPPPSSPSPLHESIVDVLSYVLPTDTANECAERILTLLPLDHNYHRGSHIDRMPTEANAPAPSPPLELQHEHEAPPPLPPSPPPGEDVPAQPRQVPHQPPSPMGSDGEPAPSEDEVDDYDPSTQQTWLDQVHAALFKK